MHHDWSAHNIRFTFTGDGSTQERSQTMTNQMHTIFATILQFSQLKVKVEASKILTRPVGENLFGFHREIDDVDRSMYL